MLFLLELAQNVPAPNEGLDWGAILTQIVVTIGVLGAAFLTYKATVKRDKPAGEAAIKEAETKGEERASLAWAEYAREERDARRRAEDKLDAANDKLDRIESVMQKYREEMARMGIKFEEWINGRTPGQ